MVVPEPLIVPSVITVAPVLMVIVPVFERLPLIFSDFPAAISKVPPDSIVRLFISTSVPFIRSFAPDFTIISVLD